MVVLTWEIPTFTISPQFLHHFFTPVAYISLREGSKVAGVTPFSPGSRMNSSEEVSIVQTPRGYQYKISEWAVK